MNKVREFLQGKKSYIMAIIGLLGAVMAWADGQIDGAGLVAGVWVAVQTMFIRAGIAKEAEKKAS